jgi:hypothetical protein
MARLSDESEWCLAALYCFEIAVGNIKVGL